MLYYCYLLAETHASILPWFQHRAHLSLRAQASVLPRHSQKFALSRKFFYPTSRTRYFLPNSTTQSPKRLNFAITKTY